MESSFSTRLLAKPGLLDNSLINLGLYDTYNQALDELGVNLENLREEEWDAGLQPTDPLEFQDKKRYKERLVAEQQRTGLSDAALTGAGMIRARRVAFGVTDSAFIMGSMGSVVGEKLTRLIERATEQSLPLIIISGSGGGAFGCGRRAQPSDRADAAIPLRDTRSVGPDGDRRGRAQPGALSAPATSGGSRSPS